MINLLALKLQPAVKTRIDEIADRVIPVCLFAYALFAPHSIALTQGFFLLGMLAWLVQMAATARFPQKISHVDLALFGFFACCVISSFASYDAMTSVKGLRSPAFFFAFYFVLNKVGNLRMAGLLAVTLVGSCLVNVAYSAGQLAVGRGIQITSLSERNPFARAALQIGDVIIEADGKSVNSLRELSDVVDSQRGRVRVKYLRGEATLEGTVSRRLIKRAPGVGPDRLGLTAVPGRNFRVSGFYSHYETYAEVLQLIAALALGLFITHPFKFSRSGLFLLGAALSMALALIMTSTRASMAGLALATLIMAMVAQQRRAFLLALLGIVVLAPIALVAIEHSRGKILFDPTEGSTLYRIGVWREALGLIRDHPFLGIGKGSEGVLKEELGLYDDGRLPPGHFHSTPIQIAAWWGLPALAFYAALMTIFFFESINWTRRLRSDEDWKSRGIILGGLGAVVAFNVASVFHFNFGDAEVVMTFWLLMGLVFAVRRLKLESAIDPRSTGTRVLPPADRSRKNQHQARESVAESGVRAAGATPGSK